jgi:hypothetical protein
LSAMAMPYHDVTPTPVVKSVLRVPRASQLAPIVADIRRGAPRYPKYYAACDFLDDRLRSARFGGLMTLCVVW